MGVYLNTFRTEFKTALFQGQPVKVFAFRFLCKAQDVDDYASPYGRKSAALLRSQCDRAQSRFESIKPAFACQVADITHAGTDSWEGIVYANPKGACHYDTEALTKEPVGFLVKVVGSQAYANGAKGWVITGERHGEVCGIMVAGHKFTRRHVERIHGGKYSQTVKSYRCETNGAELTPEAFEAWREKAQVEYVTNWEKAETERKAKETAFALRVQERRDAKNAEIQAARDLLARLESERAQIGS